MGRASGRCGPSDAGALRGVMRGVLGIGQETGVALLAGSRPNGAGVRAVMAGVAAARRDNPQKPKKGDRIRTNPNLLFYPASVYPVTVTEL